MAHHKLVVCEKPSVARSIAAVLGATSKENGHWEGGGYLVSWCYGHLVELAAPVAYGEHYKRWTRAALPILPGTWKYTASEGKQKQLDILRDLMNRADVDTIINCCDSGREGELIFRLVYEYCECSKPVQRLWISSMEDSAIRAGFENLHPGAEYDNLYHAALCRAKADWIVGLNATRLFSCLYGGATLNVGRVQSPTLAMLAEREAAVKEFVPKPFYTPVIVAGDFSVSGEKLEARADAEAVRAACDGQVAIVLSVEKKEKSEAPPKLYDLTALQRDANRLLGYTAQQTLDMAQALYEKKLLTYPRTDSRYLTEDMAAGLKELVNLTAMRLPFIKVPLPVNAALVVDNKKVSDHHALIPTRDAKDADFDALPTAERNVLWMVIVRLVCAVGEPCLYETVTASVECGGYKFSAQGRTVLKNGWKAIDAEFRASLKEKPEAKDDEEDERDGPLPDLRDGQAFPSVAASVREGKTRPPKRFTEATLLSGMESTGSENPSVAERRGLGTPATRAGVIEKLIKSGFVQRNKKLLIPSEKGSNLIAILPEDLKSPSLTADWEQKLTEVELGQLSAAAFMEDIEALTKGLVAAHAAPIPAYAHLFAQPPKGGAIGNCPRCGSVVIESQKGARLPGFFCSNRACRFVLWKDARFWAAKGKKLDKKTAAALLNEGSVFFSDLKSEKTGKTYAAAIILDDDGQRTSYRLDFNTNENGRKSA